MIVVGSTGESPLRGAIVGSTPHKLIQLSPVPVLVVPGVVRRSMDVERAIRSRRTHKAFGPEPGRRARRSTSCFELARWAPNHHLTNPWRFRVLGPEALARLKEAAEAPRPVGAKLDRAPTLVAVSRRAGRRPGAGRGGRAGRRGRRLHRAARRTRARARRLLAHAGRAALGGGARGARHRRRRARRSACCTSAARARSSARPTASRSRRS